MIESERDRAPRRRTVLAGLLAPQGNGIGGAPRPAPRHEGIYMRGFTPRHDLGSFFGKKLPKNPKKPD